MAVTKVREKFDRRRSSLRDGKRVHTHVYLVVTDDVADGTAAALTADDGTNAVPAYRSAHATNPALLALSIDAEPVANTPFHFDVTVEFSAPASNIHQDEDPLGRPPEVVWGGEEVTEPYFEDTAGNAVVNSAQQPFEQYRERESGKTVITVTRNEAAFDAVVAAGYRHTLNDDDVTIDGTTYPAGTLKMSPIAAQKATEVWFDAGVETTTTYYRVTYTVKHDAAGWYDTLLDVGFQELVGGQYRDIKGANNLIVTRPYPLDGSGARNAVPDPDPHPTVTFEPYAEADWSPLAFT